MAYVGNTPALKYSELIQQTFSSPTGTGFTLSQSVSNAKDIMLYINNVKQNPTGGYTASGTTLTVSEALVSGDTMYCMYYGRVTETLGMGSDSVDETHLKNALIGDFTDATVTAADTFLHGDATDSGNTKKDTIQGIIDLVPSATTSAAGLVEQSTSAENVTRTADNKFPSVLGVSEIVSKIPQRSVSAADTFVIADAGKHILHPSADTSARTFTIPANSSVAYEVGTAITIVNQDGGGVITLAITSDELRWYPDNSTGSRTITAPALVNLLKVAATEWVLTGVGIS